MAPVSFFATARKVSGRNGKRSASPGSPERRPQTQNKKENHIMKNRKNILTYIVAALSVLVTSASSSPARHRTDQNMARLHRRVPLL